MQAAESAPVIVASGRLDDDRGAASVCPCCGTPADIAALAAQVAALVDALAGAREAAQPVLDAFASGGGMGGLMTALPSLMRMLR